MQQGRTMTDRKEDEQNLGKGKSPIHPLKEEKELISERRWSTAICCERKICWFAASPERRKANK